MLQNRAVCVLVAPLDWGLGHATRCIPIIKTLISQGARVLIAASGTQQALLKPEFPGLEFVGIPGYAIRYKTGFLLKWGLIWRIPAILRQIKNEHDWLARCLLTHEIDAVISDNRYGLYHKNLFSVFITHQLYIQSGIDSPVGRWANQLILKWNNRFISKFSECWVPDQEGIFSIAGKLSHPPVLPSVPVKYTGILSRFNRDGRQIIKNTLLVLLSGPEPQRTLLETILFRQLAGSSLNTVMMLGLPGGEDVVPFIRDGIEVFHHLPSDRLNKLLQSSEYIITRSGYSTIMDLVTLQRNAVLIPTPGQTEQEYLGRYLHEKKWMYTVPQKEFNLEKALKGFQQNELVLPEIGESPLYILVENLIRDCIQKKK